MKTRVWNKDSLIYRLAYVYGTKNEYQTVTDICSLMRSCFAGLVAIISVSLAIGIALSGVVELITIAILSITNHIYPAELNPSLCAVITFIVLMVGCISVLGYFIEKAMETISDILYERRIAKYQKERYDIMTGTFVPPKQSLLDQIGLMYHSFKEKTCIKIKFED